jgi:hypothetical protein
VPLLGRFGFVKRALARNWIATVMTHVAFAMVVAGLRPEATGVLILIGAHSGHRLLDSILEDVLTDQAFGKTRANKFPLNHTRDFTDYDILF